MQSMFFRTFFLSVGMPPYSIVWFLPGADGLEDPIASSPDEEGVR